MSVFEASRLSLPHLLPPGRMIRRAAEPNALRKLFGDWQAWLAANAPLLAPRVIVYLDGRGPSVYLVESGPGGPIKIGVSSCIGQRLADLQVSNPDKLSCLLTISGGTNVELMLHSVLRESRIRGEWFRRSIELDVFIALGSRPIRQWGHVAREAA